MSSYWIDYDVTLKCPECSAQPGEHTRRVPGSTAEAAGKRARFEFRVEHWYKGDVEIISSVAAPSGKKIYKPDRTRRARPDRRQEA